MLVRLCRTIVTVRAPSLASITFARTISMSASQSRSRPTSSFPDLSPPRNVGMGPEALQQDSGREQFTLRLPLVAVKVPARDIGRLKKELGSATLSLSRVQAVADDPNSTDGKLLVLDKSSQDELPSEIQATLEREDLATQPHEVALTYDYWSANQILKAILPDELHEDLPSSFTIVGHIAHFNLREDYLPYKRLIGRVILDKSPSLRTVVNKLDSIDTEFRYFAMEVLAGDADFIVTTSENGCTFRFDFSKVYWNSRLQVEHTRLVESFEVGKDVVADGYAGVGPFAVPAARAGCLGVYANDLNPMSAEALRDNVRINKLEDNIRTYNVDGGEFFKQAVIEAYNTPFKPRKGPRVSATKAAKLARSEREARKKAGLGPAAATNGSASHDAPSTGGPGAEQDASLGRFIDHFVLNLPATAIEHIGCFRGIYTPLMQSEAGEEAVWQALRRYSEARGWHVDKEGGYRYPMVHCYCFTKEVDDFQRDICERATRYLGYPVGPDTLRDFNLHLVRSVAPKKDMYCLSFRLPKEVVFGEKPASP